MIKIKGRHRNPNPKDQYIGDINPDYFNLPDRSTERGRLEYYDQREIFKDAKMYPKEHEFYYPELYHKVPKIRFDAVPWRGKLRDDFTYEEGVIKDSELTQEYIEFLRRHDSREASKKRMNESNYRVNKVMFIKYLKNRELFRDEVTHKEMHELYYPDESKSTIIDFFDSLCLIVLSIPTILISDEGIWVMPFIMLMFLTAVIILSNKKMKKHKESPIYSRFIKIQKVRFASLAYISLVLLYKLFEANL